MKRLIIILLLATLAGSAYGQHYDGRPRKDEHRKEQSHRPSKKKVEPKHRPDRHDGPARGVRSHGGKHDVLRDVACVGDWQELWNGCHVRLKTDRVHIYTHDGDRLLSGDAIVLLWNGCYKVRVGDFWHVHDRKGDRIFNVWGDSVELMRNGIFRCYRNGRYYYYDSHGDQRE